MAKTVQKKPQRRAKAVSKKRRPTIDPALAKMPTAFQNAPPRADGTAEGVNGSQINEFMRCPYRWEVKNRRLIDRREIAPPMDLGSAVHAGMSGAILVYAELGSPQKLSKINDAAVTQAALQGVRNWRKTWMEEHLGNHNLSDELDTQLNEMQVKAFELADRALDELELERWEVIRYKDVPLVEQKIIIPFLPKIPFYGTPDVVWKDRSRGGVWPTDYKVRQHLQAVEHEEVDLQLPAYQYMLGHLGIATVGSIKFQIRAELPKVPTLNKDKTMSRQRIATTWEVYESTLKLFGLNPASYQEMRQKLDVEFFRLDQLYRNPFEIQSFWDNIIMPLGKQLVGAKEFIRHMHFINCGGCWARELCLSELRGEDTGFLLETQFIDLANPKPKMMLRPEDVMVEVDG